MYSRCLISNFLALFTGGLHFFWLIWIWILQSKMRFFIPFHCNPILDCNPNNPPSEADHSDWYLKLVLDCSFHLINWFVDRVLDCLITWIGDQKSLGNLDPGTSDLLSDFMFQLVSNLIQFSIEEYKFRLVKSQNAPLIFTHYVCKSVRSEIPVTWLSM